MEQFDAPAMDARLRWLHPPASSTLGPSGLTVHTRGETGKQGSCWLSCTLSAAASLPTHRAAASLAALLHAWPPPAARGGPANTAMHTATTTGHAQTSGSARTTGLPTTMATSCTCLRSRATFAWPRP